MGAYSYYCAKVQPHLQGLLQQWDETSAILQRIPDEQDVAIQTLEAEATAAKSSYNETKSRISTYIRMATGGEEYEPASSGRMATVDFAALRQLSSRESPSPNGHQLKLYDEACAQYRYIISQVQSVDSRLRQTTADTMKRFSEEQRQLEGKLGDIERQYRQYFSSSEFAGFIEQLLADNNTVVDGSNITIGYAKSPMSVTAAAALFLEDKWPDLFDAETRSVNIAYRCDLHEGGVFIVNYDSSCEDIAIHGIHNFVVNAVQNGLAAKVYLFDPVRYNDEMLGTLSPLAGAKGSPIARVPLSDAEITKSIAAMREEITRWENDLSHTEPLRLNHILILNQFPQEYNSDTIKCIRFLSVNAKRNGLTIFLLNSSPESVRSSNNELSYISSKAIVMDGEDEEFTISNGTTVGYSWPSEQAVLSPELIAQFEQETEQIDFNNDYESRVGYLSEIPHKGNRVLANIPFGIDKDGNVATIHFEDEFFGTFICGAARSGKTTLLHTIINGLLCHHPDDVELWLIDFKKVEFAQYIEHHPPHVRYILLENSPEIVFDIVDELTKKMNLRKEVFKKNGWTKLADVPPTRSMPAVVIMIDEFSEMSGILASSEDYREKFRILFSEGAAFGFRFILSCQAFSEGTKGLAEFAKMQIQQRIVLKSVRAEIKGTLDINHLSDDDQHMVENLEPHYAIQRMPLDTRGNLLKKVHVLYQKDKQHQFDWIDRMSLPSTMTAVRRYDPYDDTVYGDKLPIVIDGNTYATFRQVTEAIRTYIEEEQKKAYIRQTLLFIGTPLRMKQVDAIRLTNSLKENILLIASQQHMMLASSIIYSIAASMHLQPGDHSDVCELWGMTFDPYIVQARKSLPDNLRIVAGIAQIRDRLCEIYDDLQDGVHTCKMITVCNLDMIQRELSNSTSEDSYDDAMEEVWPQLQPREGAATSTNKALTPSFDTMLKAVLKDGPVNGFHCMLVFNSVTAYTQCRLSDLFQHKILFRTSAQEAINLMPAAQAIHYAKLASNQYRYFNGLDCNTYRPYFHRALEWDNLTMDISGDIHPIHQADEDDYLF